jgi:predicted ArsR family transcriptional regulator
MRREYHPNAWLTAFRNVRPGLERRTDILCQLDRGSATTKRLSEETGVSYSTVRHHLRNLEGRGIIARASSKPPFRWKVNPIGQQRLIP